jgi:predicted RNA-binding Zn ribbon-like protein
MSSRLVDGLTLPDQLAGQVALDFCNTRAGWNAERPKEYLVQPEVLAIWSREAGLISAQDARWLITAAGLEPETALAVHRRALALREALYPVCLGRGNQAEWAVVAAEAETARAHTRLVAGAEPGTPASWQPVWAGQQSPVLAVATAAAELLTGALTGSVRACPRPDCGWLFTDPRGRRRWCSMAVCGNRAKADRFRDGRDPKDARVSSG